MSATIPPHTPVGLMRRLGAMIYDGLLLTALLMVTELLIVAPFSVTEHHPLFKVVHLYVPVVAFLFLGWFWTRAQGQTLGMQAWRVRLVGGDGNRVRWSQAAMRFIVALGQWCLILAAIALYVAGWQLGALVPTALVVIAIVIAQRHPQRLMLHDRLSGTRLVKTA